MKKILDDILGVVVIGATGVTVLGLVAIGVVAIAGFIGAAWVAFEVGL